MSWDDLSKNNMQWPSVLEVTEYRRQVYQLVRNVILTHPELDNLPITMDGQLWALFMGFEHENIHIETSSVLMREMPIQYLSKPPQWPAYEFGNLDGNFSPYNEFLKVEAGEAVLGKPTDFPSFGWDNEYGQRKFQVDEFEATKNLVSNGEFLEFVKQGGYHNTSYWTEEGWKWRSFRNAKWPTFWVPNGPAGLHQYKLRLMFEELDHLPLHLPAVVNLHEAKAYCKWHQEKDQQSQNTTYRLLCEAEHHRLRQRSPITQPFDPVMKFSGEDFRGTLNLNLAYGSETPVNGLQSSYKSENQAINDTVQQDQQIRPFANSNIHNLDQQFNDVFGNVWQWCEDFFAALPKSNGVHPYYDDFSTPCYDGQHNIIMGGSFISTGQEASIYARYHFRPHFFQHAGFRVVRSLHPPQLSHIDSPPPHVGGWNPSSRQFDDDNQRKQLQRLIMLHYTLPPLQLSDSLKIQSTQSTWPKSLLKSIIRMSQTDIHKLRSILIIGAGVGGVAFAIAKLAPTPRIVALDANEARVKICQQIQLTNNLTNVQALVPDQQFDSEQAIQIQSQIEFKWMDPVAIAPDLGVFDIVIMDSVLEYVTSPKGPLKRMSGARGLVREQGGILAVVSRYDWSEEICDKKLWLSREKGDEKEGLAGLQRVLQEECDFGFVDSGDVPAVIQTKPRIVEVQNHHLSVWRRN
eukprot:TRINITY_DN8972_c0_g1_i4.p1 TRINITY_DN8972_c0_g1~~TRINITY_DN8972_c0_g1_i4.p1  ORF type:complete len:688 (-),score=79.71 TRINITY_DN8972_c0_g1_i4:406-2469(-)